MAIDPNNYSLTDYFGGKDTEGYRQYKEGQKSGKWSDLPGFIAQGGTPTGLTLFEQQAKTEEDFLNRYNKAIADQPTTSDIYNRLSQEYGLDEARANTSGLTQTALGLENTLSTLPSRIEGETRGFDVNANQLSRIQEERAKPLTDQLNQAAAAANRASLTEQGIAGNVATQLGLETADLAKQLQPFDVEAQMISDRAARELTGYTAQLQNETNQLIAKLNTQGQLDQIEAQRLADLAIQEDKYNQMYDYYNKTNTGSGVNQLPDIGNDAINFFGNF